MKKLILVGLILVGSLIASDVKPARNKLFLTECGSCHFAFQPGLLPNRSWKKIMKNLSNHFGVDASLDKKDNQTLSRYLASNSSDNSSEYLSRVINRYVSRNSTPIRFTKTRVFKNAHHELRSRVFRRKSILHASNCIACHTTANRGIYNEDYVRIPR
jgi:cytochrome c